MSGAVLAHRLAGEGLPVAFANGGMMSFPSWEPVVAGLRDGCRTLTFDFRGQLLSPGEPPDGLAGHAGDFEALLDAVGWPSAHLVATSFGALVSLTLAARRPERVKSLLIVTAMDRATPEFDRATGEMREVIAAIAAGAERAAFYDLLVAGVYSERYRAAEAAAIAERRAQVGALPLAWFTALDKLLATVHGFDLTPLIARVGCPTRVVVAEDDRVVDPGRSRALAAALGAEVVSHPTSGHALVAEEPRWLTQVCREFLADAERRES